MIDWSKAQLTMGAQRSKESDRLRVVKVPRASFTRELWEMSWADFAALAAKGERGLEPWLVFGNDRAPEDACYVREGLAGRMPHGDGSLAGRVMLYSQGWTA